MLHQQEKQDQSPNRVKPASVTTKYYTFAIKITFQYVLQESSCVTLLKTVLHYKKHNAGCVMKVKTSVEC